MYRIAAKLFKAALDVNFVFFFSSPKLMHMKI